MITISEDVEFSMIILKPDIVEQRLVLELKKELKKNGITVAYRFEITFDLEFIKKLYQWNKLLYPHEIKEYLCFKPLTVWLLKGKHVIKKTLIIKREFRKRYSKDELHTLIHAPDSENGFIREFDLITKRKGLNMKTNNQVEVIVFKEDTQKEFSFLMLKRNPKKGGFWQPITGNVREGESFAAAALRELKEETGINEIIELIDTGYSFEFLEDNRKYFEKVYGTKVKPDTEIILSSEHTEFTWASKDESLNKILKYPGNKEGLRKLAEKIGLL